MTSALGKKKQNKGNRSVISLGGLRGYLDQD